jgi:hypothetical protein
LKLRTADLRFGDHHHRSPRARAAVAKRQFGNSSSKQSEFNDPFGAHLITDDKAFIERLEAAIAELVTDNSSFAESFMGWLFERHKKIASEKRLPSRGRGS